jgi:hypothetical protein
MAWTYIADPDEAERLLPSWLGRHLIAMHGTFGLLLGTGDIMRITSISAVHHSSDGVILIDVLLDTAGVPEGVDLAGVQSISLARPCREPLWRQLIWPMSWRRSSSWHP